MKQDNIWGLNCLIDSKKESTRALVLFHGYGASMHDLAPLTDHLEFDGDLYFPEGILEISMSPYIKGYAWFPIDMKLLEEKMNQGLFRDFADFTPDGFTFAIDKMTIFLENLKKQYDEVIIGGFSQGAMCSLHLVNRLEFSNLIMLSGNPIAMNEYKNNNKLNFFQSHGKQDPVLSYDSAKHLYKNLKDQKNQGRFISFNGGHEIPLNVLAELNTYLKDSLTN